MDKSTLSCGEPVDFTMYDFLKGLAQRRQLPSRIEPEVALVFRASESDNTVDMLEVETFLRSAIDTVNIKLLINTHILRMVVSPYVFVYNFAAQT